MDLILSALTWDIGFRGLLTVVLATLILGGSIWLIISTNSGWRLGFLLTLTALMGWMMIMGLVWAMYGIGYQGRVATWHVEEVNYGNLAEANTTDARTIPPRDQLPSEEELRAIIEGNEALATQFPDDPTRRAPQLGDLLSVDPELREQLVDEGVLIETDDGWVLLASADKQTGEAVASASAYLTEERALFESASEFVVLDSWTKGGKDNLEDDSLVDRAMFKIERIAEWPLGHPTHRVVVRVQPVVHREPIPGQPPPTPEADETQPVISVVMVRDLGSRRLPALVLFGFSAIVFAICCNSLHRHDELVAEARAAAAAGARPMGQYLPVVTLFVLAVLFAVISRVASGILAPRRPTPAKTAPYECGIVPSREPPERFPVRFYFVAMIFIVFDIEIVFLYPYAVIHREIGVFGFVEMVAFAVVVFASFVFLIGNRGLDWGPSRRERPAGEGSGMVSVERTTATTIRRVGLEGRAPARDPEAA